jgi:hypothetical protein
VENKDKFVPLPLIARAFQKLLKILPGLEKEAGESQGWLQILPNPTVSLRSDKLNSTISVSFRKSERLLSYLPDTILAVVASR